MQTSAERPEAKLGISNGKPGRMPTMMGIVASGTALTDNVHTQKELAEAFKRHWRDEDVDLGLLDRFFHNVEVETRHLALPIEEYLALNDFTASNDTFIRVGTDLGEEAVRTALTRAALQPSDIDAIFFTTVTGVSVPTIDALLANRLGFRRDIKRFPLFGLGCVAGVAGIARLADYLKAWPDHTAILLSVELCSLTLQKTDWSIPAIVSAALFGDGSAAVIGLGRDVVDESNSIPMPKVKATKSVFYPDTERVMGWDVGNDGFSVVLSADVPNIVETHMRGDVDSFLSEHGLAVGDIASWVCHPGGPRVIAALQRALDLHKDDLASTWKSLKSTGNLSSSSVLFVLDDILRSNRQPTGSPGIMIAMGPGFCSEFVLFEW